MENDKDWTDEKDKKFAKIEEKYLRASGEYAAKKLAEEYGEEKASIYANRGRINTGKNAVQALSDEWKDYAIDENERSWALYNSRKNSLS
jgi:hypothetical protein